MTFTEFLRSGGYYDPSVTRDLYAIYCATMGRLLTRPPLYLDVARTACLKRLLRDG